MKNMKVYLTFCSLTLVLLAGCALRSENVEDHPNAQASIIPQDTQITETTRPTPSDNAPYKQEQIPQGAVLSYQRSGGFAGIEERWIVYADGHIQDSQGNEWYAPVDMIQELLQTIDGLEYFSLHSSYLTKNTCCDRFIYQLIVQYGGKTHQVVTIDANEDTPEALKQILVEVQSFLNKYTR
jgi:hypothetical protein